MARKIFLYFICALLGAVFILSGILKLDPIEPFEFSFVDMGLGNWQAAPFLARIMIGVEFLVGILLLMNVNLRKFTYRFSILILIVFSLYLFGIIIFAGNKGNCGCFGEHIVMTPFQALIKNLSMIVLLLILNKYHEGWVLKGRLRLILLIPAVVSISLPFILNPVQLDYSVSYLNKPEENFKLELDTLYAHASLNVPPQDLREGKKVISFMTLTCPHCRTAAKKMRIILERNPEIPFYIVLNGKEEKLKAFYEDTGAEKIPHCMLKGRSFITLAGNSWPAVYLVNNGIVEHQLDYLTLDQEKLERWLAE
jgi:uncharacterized membrane protein YphA (DoxX/SURF4 family)